MDILIIAPEDITKPRGGAANRNYNLANALKRAGNTVIILQPKNIDNTQAKSDEFDVYSYHNHVGKRDLYCFSDFNPFFFYAATRILARRHIDVIHVETPWGVPTACALRRLTGKRQKVVYSSHNVQAAVQNDIARRTNAEKGAGFLAVVTARALALNTCLIERLSARRSDMILSVSADDKRAFMRTYGVDGDKVQLVPNGTSLRKAQAASRNKAAFGLDQSKLAVVFHGTYAYKPNVEAIGCIIERIAPYFEKRSAAVEFVIAGKGVPRSASNNVKCLGFVDDIYALLKSSDVAIVPLKTGGGTRLKILDYFAVGLPVVTTQKGVESIEAEDQQHALIVKTEADFVKALNYLIDHKEERERIGANALTLIEGKYDWDSIGASLNAHYGNLMQHHAHL